jgi:TDG/mug DNA glycosylase family protein
MTDNPPIPGSEAPAGGLLPVCGRDPRVLILGSFPSVLSLQGTMYYGNPRNRFWRIMEDLFSIKASLPYKERIGSVKAQRIALWDVVSSCSRKGSADSNIRNPVFNDIGGFLATRPSITLIALNGSSAARYFRQSFQETEVEFVILPSTSPAHARARYEDILEKWEIIKKHCAVIPHN